MNAKLIRPDGLYTDGLSSAAGNAQINNTRSIRRAARSTPGIAPAANREALADEITPRGCTQGPMTWHVLLRR